MMNVIMHILKVMKILIRHISDLQFYRKTGKIRNEEVRIIQYVDLIIIKMLNKEDLLIMRAQIMKI